MARLRIAVLVLIAALFAIEPALHHHSLALRGDSSATSQAPCAVCATGAAKVTLNVATVEAPSHVLYSLATRLVCPLSPKQSLSLPSRAPPAA